MNLGTRSWKTTTFGISGLVVVLGGALGLLTDNNPQTNPDWNTVVAAVIANIGLIFARDNDKTSTQLGLTKPPTPPTVTP